MSSSKRRRVALSALLIAVLGAGGVILWEMYKPRNDPRLIGKAPVQIKLIPRSRFEAKPWVSIPWFGGGKLQFPQPVTMPTKWKDTPLASGILVWEDPKPRATPAITGNSMNIGEMFGMVMAAMMRWKSEDGEVLMQSYNPLEIFEAYSYAEVPYVFGDKPMRCEIAPRTEQGLGSTGLGLRAFSLELPPLGKPAPELETVKVKEGGIELTFTPKKWTGPSFWAEYAVTATGIKEGEHAFLSSNAGADAVEIDSLFWCRVSPGKTSTIWAGAPKLKFFVAIVKAENAKIRVVKSASPIMGSMGGIAEVEYKDPYGATFARGLDYTHSLFPGVAGLIQPESALGSEATFAGAQIKGQWLGYPFDLNAVDYLSNQVWVSKPHPVGVYDGILYRIKDRFEVTVDGLRIPEADLLKYVSQK